MSHDLTATQRLVRSLWPATTTEVDVQAEADVRAFAVEFPTPNVVRAVALCESGQLLWTTVAELFATSTAKAIAEVAK